MKIILGGIIVVTLFLSGCKNNQESQSNLKDMNSKLTDKDLAKLKGMRIYFGHQSVGYNIVNGINLLVNDSQPKLEIIEGLPGKDSKPGFYHTPIGKNYFPMGKIDDFVSKMESGTGSNVDIAFFKFCFVDFSKETNVDSLFEYYKKAMTRLRAEFPATKFIYCTVPLVCNNGQIKTFLKLLLGRGNNNKIENIKRNEFNKLIQNEYDNKEIIFDIAKLESDNYKSYFLKNKTKIFTLNPDFSSDGSHLNDLGSKIVAENLLEIIVSLN
jgi:hypothetical protein